MWYDRKRWLAAWLMSFFFGGIGFALATAKNAGIQIDAGDGIVWSAAKNHYLASGRVRIIHRGMIAWSNTAKAYYRDSPDDIIRLTLEGVVNIERAGVTLQGDLAEVDLDSSQIVMRGNNLRLDTVDSALTARDFFRYDTQRHRFDAEGDVLLLHRGRRLSAQQIAVDMIAHAQQSGRWVADQITMRDQVRADDGHADPSQRLYVEAQSALYRVQDQTLRLCGETRILRGENVMQGDCAHYDLAGRDFVFLTDATLTSPLPAAPGSGQETPAAVDAADNNAVKQDKPAQPRGRTRLILKTQD